MNPLAITGIGAITPAGAGWPGLALGASAAASSLPTLRDPAAAFSVFLPDEPALLRWNREPRLRRASRITSLLAEAADQALAGRRPERLGIVGAFFTGPCHCSRSFFEPVIRQGPSFASPALFPETVYNSCLSHLAHLFGVQGACYALIGDDSAWVNSLQVASVWLDAGIVDDVLVVGGEELDASAIEAYAAAGWLEAGFVPAEGAAALLVSRAKNDLPEIRISAVLDGFGYRSRKEAARAVAECIDAMAYAPVLSTAARTWMSPLVGQTASNRSLESVEITSPAVGHAFTATAGWHTLLACRWLLENPSTERLWVPVWGLDHQVSALQLEVVGSPSLALFEPAG
jgi:3-oxoacyl-(acyl-carrier-protein) synthase